MYLDEYKMFKDVICDNNSIKRGGTELSRRKVFAYYCDIIRYTYMLVSSTAHYPTFRYFLQSDKLNKKSHLPIGFIDKQLFEGISNYSISALGKSQII